MKQNDTPKGKRRTGAKPAPRLVTILTLPADERALLLAYRGMDDSSRDSLLRAAAAFVDHFPAVVAKREPLRLVVGGGS